MPAPDPMRVKDSDQIRCYGCVKCQKTHVEGERLFQAHLYHQSKHGWYWISGRQYKLVARLFAANN